MVGNGDDSCPNTAIGLLGAVALATSPDGRSVYVAAMDSDAVVALRRSTGGSLYPVTSSAGSCVAAPQHDSCAQRASGLGGADAVAVSPNGHNVYVGSVDSSAVVAFVRTGGGRLIALRGKGACVQGNPVIPGAGGQCGLHDPAMQAVSAVAISRDGRFVYALSAGTSVDADSLVTLRRDPSSGRLTPVGDRKHGCVAPLGNHSCHLHAAGLRGASSIAISPDRRYAYVAGELSSAVVALARNPRTGTLAPVHGSGGCAEDLVALPAPGDARCVVLAGGLGGAKALALSPDGRFVYVASFDPGGVAVLARDPATGALGQLTGPGACLVPTGSDVAPTDCAQVDGLRGATAVVLARSGTSLYIATTTGNSVLQIARDPASGRLGAIAPAHDVAGLNAPSSMVLTPGGANLYLVSPIDDAVLALTGS